MLATTAVDFARCLGQCGFDPAREERLADMLRFRDVHRDPPQGKASR